MPIGVVARQAGVPADALRQRARRHRLPVVRRGRRLFLSPDVARLIVQLYQLLDELDRLARGGYGAAAVEPATPVPTVSAAPAAEEVAHG